MTLLRRLRLPHLEWIVLQRVLRANIRPLLLAACLVLIGGPTIVHAGQNLLDTDAFNGTNGDTLTTYSANWPLFGNWNQLGIRGSPPGGFGTGVAGSQGNRRTGQPFTDDHWAEITLDTLADTALFVGARATDEAPAGRGYGGGWDFGPTVYQIVRFNPDGSKTTLLNDPGSNTSAPSDIINVQVVGTTITLKVTRGGSQLLSISTVEGTYPSGGTPLLFASDATTNRLGGTWRAGSVTADAAGQPPRSMHQFRLRR